MSREGRQFTFGDEGVENDGVDHVDHDHRGSVISSSTEWFLGPIRSGWVIDCEVVSEPEARVLLVRLLSGDVPVVFCTCCDDVLGKILSNIEGQLGGEEGRGEDFRGVKDTRTYRP